MKSKYWITGLIILAIIILAGWYLDAHYGGKLLSTDLNRLVNQTVNNQGLSDYGQAPDFAGISAWHNSPPLTMAGLKGKVVLVDFWTYSCINCLRTLPHQVALYDKYQNQGLVIVGVHTPEFAFEKDSGNVAKALVQQQITYPVAQDNDYQTWDAYHNEYWPADYLVDQTGKIVYEHFGEGDYANMEKLVRQLLRLDPQASNEQDDNLQVGSPEMYFGLERQANLTTKQTASTVTQDYQAPAKIPLNAFALDGRWQFSDQDMKLLGPSGKIFLTFRAGQVNLVASSQPTNNLIIKVDGQTVAPVVVQDAKLYTLWQGPGGQHQLEIDVPQAGLQAFTFTFG